MMKRFGMVYPPQEKKNPRNNFVYSTEFQAMLDGLEEDEDDCKEEIGGQGTEKKRRLSLEQVKALEKIFEVDNKLEPERKVRVAEELDLQPRQVAIWFQNRRARWKTKQLERDYDLLKANYEALKVNYDNLEKQREALKAELKELGAKLGEENTDNNDSAKEETILIKESENNFSEVSLTANEESHLINPQLLLSPASSSLKNECSSSMYWMNCFQFFDSRAVPANVPAKGYPIPHQFVRMEEESLFSSGEEFSSTIFSVDQAPTLHWQH